MYSRKSVTMQNVMLFLLDLISIAASLGLGFVLRAFLGNTINYNGSDFVRLLFIFLFSYALLMGLVGVNKNFKYNSVLQEFGNVIKIDIFIAIISTFLIYVLRIIALDFSRGVFAIALIANLIIMFIFHRSYLRYLKHNSRKKYYKRQLFIITNYEKAEMLEEKISSYEELDYHIVGFHIMDKVNYPEVRDINGYQVLSDSQDPVSFCLANVVDEVFIMLPEYQLGEISEVVEKFSSMGVTIHFNVDLFQYDVAANKTITSIGDMYAVTFANKFLSFRQQVLKRALDIVGGLIGSAIALVLMLIFGPIIKAQSPGPVLFKQKRVGKNGRFFYIYKFRSMVQNAEALKAQLLERNEADGNMFKMQDDPRITKIGRFIRRTSIDEFPQFFNVLKGDMSLVGTRPPTVDEFSNYESHHKLRLSIKPGITGMWQVSGRSDITSFEEVVRLDTWYINNYSPLLDIKILLKTVLVVINHKGAK